MLVQLYKIVQNSEINSFYLLFLELSSVTTTKFYSYFFFSNRPPVAVFLLWRPGQLLFPAASAGPGCAQGSERHPGMRRLQHATRHLLLDAQRKPGLQHHPKVPGRVQPAHHEGRPLQRLGRVQMHRHECDHWNIAGEPGRTTQHTM